MGEGFRHHIAARLFLQAVVAHSGRRRQRFFGVARLQDLPRPPVIYRLDIVRLDTLDDPDLRRAILGERVEV